MATKHSTKIIAKATRQDIIVTREFEAPRELVFKAHSTPELYGQWIGPRKFTMEFERYDFRSGGSWRYVFTDMDGHKLAFHGVFHEIKTGETIVGTFEFEGPDGYVILNSSTFENLPGNRSRLSIQSVFETPEDREAELRFLTEDGLNDIFSRLDDLLKKIK